jgi:valyl-tRNA synthetase
MCRMYTEIPQNFLTNTISSGEQTGPVSGAPPKLSDDTKDAILNAASEQHVGQSAPGKDGGDKDAGKKQKSEKELKKEAAKAEKLKKFQEKQQKTKQAAPAAKEKSKKPKAEVEELTPYVEKTPKGAKKILESLDDPHRKAYIPEVVESAWGDFWEANGYFKPEFDDGNVKKAGYFVISIPPPNVTGQLVRKFYKRIFASNFYHNRQFAHRR